VPRAGGFGYRALYSAWQITPMDFARRYRYNTFGNLSDHNGRSSVGGSNRGCGKLFLIIFLAKYIKKVVSSGRNNAGYSE
jgi:hypothetical protein